MSYKSDVNMDFVAYSNRELQDLIESETGYDVSTYVKKNPFSDDAVDTSISLSDKVLSSSADFDIADEVVDESDEKIEVVKVIQKVDESSIESDRVKELEALTLELKNKLSKSVIG